MKQINCPLLLMFTVFVLGFSSCKKSSNAPPIPQIGATSISLKFNGNFYNSPSAVATYNKNSGTIQIGGLFGTNAYIDLVIFNVRVGTFDLSGGNALLSFTDGGNVVDAYLSTSGTAVISQFTDTTIVGTFQFTGVDSLNVSRQITDGVFTTSYNTIQ